MHERGGKRERGSGETNEALGGGRKIYSECSW